MRRGSQADSTAGVNAGVMQPPERKRQPISTTLTGSVGASTTGGASLQSVHSDPPCPREEEEDFA